jgi:hypothetical protein
MDMVALDFGIWALGVFALLVVGGTKKYGVGAVSIFIVD